MIDKEYLIEQLNLKKEVFYENSGEFLQIQAFIDSLESGIFDIKEKPLYSEEFTNINIEIEDLKNTVKCSQHDIFIQGKEISNLRKDNGALINIVEEIEKLKTSNADTNQILKIYARENIKLEKELKELKENIKDKSLRIIDSSFKIEDLKKMIFDQKIKISEIQTIIEKIGEAIND